VVPKMAELFMQVYQTMRIPSLQFSLSDSKQGDRGNTINCLGFGQSKAKNQDLEEGKGQAGRSNRHSVQEKKLRIPDKRQFWKLICVD
jgi:hypothetical protein